MRRAVSGLLASVDALALVAIGLAVALIPATAVWAFQYGFAADFGAFWRFSANLWLMGHGVDLTVVLDPVLAAQMGLSDTGGPLRLTIALLGFALLTAQFAFRSGRRAALADDPLASLIGAAITTAALSALITLSAASPAALPSRPQGILLPTAIVIVAMTAGIVLEQRRRGERGWLDAWASWLRWEERFSVVLRRDITASLAGGLAVVAGLLTLAGIALAVMILINYAAVVGIYQTLQGGILGGGILTIGQLVLLPNLVVWSAAWLVGAGFSIGVGSSISPAATVIGPLPAIPVFGAIPQPSTGWGFIVLLVPVLFGFIVAMVLRQRHDRYSSPARTKVILGLAFGIGLAAAAMLALLSWWSAGAIGPDRLQEVGPDPLLVAAWTFGTVFIGASVGGYAGRLTDK